MFKNIGQQEVHPRDRAARLFTLFVSTVVFALIIYVVLLLANVIPTAESREYERRLRRGQEILEILDMQVVDAGFIRKATSAQKDIYMPQLVLRLVNSSKEKFSQIILECRFSKGKQFICGGRSYANELEPGEVRTLSMKCVESGFMGAVIYGVGLEDAKQGLEFEIVLKAENISVVALRDTITFKLL